MARGKPKGAPVTSRPMTLIEEQNKAAARAREVFQQDNEGGRKWTEPGALAKRCNDRWEAGWEFYRLIVSGGNEYIFLWKRRET